MIAKFCLSAAELDRMLVAAIAKAAELGLAASIAIVDEGGYAFRLYRSDGAGLMTPAVALAKARTAALMRAPSGALTTRLKDEPELLRLTEYLPMPGGLPVRHPAGRHHAAAVQAPRRQDHAGRPPLSLPTRTLTGIGKRPTAPQFPFHGTGRDSSPAP